MSGNLTQGTSQPYLVGLGLIFGGGAGMVFGSAFEAPGMGLLYGAGLGLAVATVLFAIANNRQVSKPTQTDDPSGRR